MKNFRFLTALLFMTVVTITIDSCKKGPEDPFLSLRSRNSRLMGTWKMTTMDNVVFAYTYSHAWTNDVNSDVINETGSGTRTYSCSGGTSLTSTLSESYSGTETHKEFLTSWSKSTNEETYTNIETTSFSVGYEISIYEDGTYSFKRSKNQTTRSWNWDKEVDGDQIEPSPLNLDTDDDGTNASTYKDDVTKTGTWAWDDYGPKEGDKKVKLYAGPLSGYLIRLSNKELKIEPGVGSMSSFLSGLGNNLASLSFSHNSSYSYFDGYSFSSGNYNDLSVDESRTIKTDDVTLLTYSSTNPSETDKGITTDVIVEKLTISGGISTWEKTDKEESRKTE